MPVCERAQHYGTAFLTQIMLSKHDAQLAKELISCYLGLFCKQMEDAKKNKGKPVESRTLTAILSGLNRALPFAPPITEDQQNAPAGKQSSKSSLGGGGDVEVKW